MKAKKKIQARYRKVTEEIIVSIEQDQTNDITPPISTLLDQAAELNLDTLAFESKDTIIETQDEMEDKLIIPDTSDQVEARLACWIALEVLSPRTFLNVSDLAEGYNSKAVMIESKLPWEAEQSENSDKIPIFYEVILGSIKTNEALQSILSALGVTQDEDISSNSKSVLASILLDSKGKIVETEGVAISSFGWAITYVLDKRFDILANWPYSERKLKKDFTKECKRQMSLNSSSIFALYEWIVNELNIPKDMVEPPKIIIIKQHRAKSSPHPGCSLLNSFYIDDLCEAVKNYQNDSMGIALKQYLGKISPNGAVDILTDYKQLEHSISPLKFNRARWPVGNNRGLVLLQQAAINLMNEELKQGGIFAVNGPPGTGKTTLLRDQVTKIITDRALAMTDFANPNDAFSDTDERVSSGAQGHWKVYKLDDKIKGHEIIIASSNNAAVENISHELPASNAISDNTYRYFPTISNAIAKTAASQLTENQESVKNTWGLIAAALGNSSNRSLFQKAFWWDNEASFRLYLKAARGDDVSQEIIDKNTKEVIDYKTPEVVTKEIPPVNEFTANTNWNVAKQKFLTLNTEIENDIKELEALRQLFLDLTHKNTILENRKNLLTSSGNALSKLFRPEHQFNLHWHSVKRNLDTGIDVFFANNRIAPHFIHQLFRLKKGRAWSAFKDSYSNYCLHRNSMTSLEWDIEDKKKISGSNAIDHMFFERTHQEIHTMIPWFSNEINTKREQLFQAALDVHKAFIDCTAHKLLHNLSILMMYFQNTRALRSQHLQDIWSSLFLCVPVISTTFPSVQNMIGNMPKDSFGWLLIDEAGQATPQAAVGAIMRAKRVVVVGDPMQIEPVTNLDSQVCAEIAKTYNVEFKDWIAPISSSQTLADRASKYQSTFKIDTAERIVGVPLLVHRRCANPMFTISNEIAYNKLMVSQVNQNHDEITTILGPSHWVNIAGSCESKWCREEGIAIIKMLKKLATNKISKPDIFIISPFKIVASEMRKLIYSEEALILSLGLDVKQFARNNIGTIHTFQGREAGTVILLLGAPMKSQVGARKWAASNPNILNVAASRAKRNLYVVGSRNAWAKEGCFAVLANHCPAKNI